MDKQTPLTRADIIQRVREHFSKPDTVLAFDGAKCIYRGENDPASPVRCFVGVIIPDEIYNPEFENEPASLIFDVLAPLVATDVTPAWLDNLQAIHDDHAAGGVHFHMEDLLRDLDYFASRTIVED